MTDREAFEEWAQTQGADLTWQSDKGGLPAWRYSLSETEAAWRAWQAATARAEAQNKALREALRDRSIPYICGREDEPLVKRRLLSVVMDRPYTESDRIADLPSTGLVYLIDEGADESPVKVGLTSEGWAGEVRIYDLQNGNPRQLRQLCRHPGTRDLEQHIHRQLKPWRIRGEWFERSQEVQRFIYTATREGYRAALNELATKARQI